MSRRTLLGVLWVCCFVLLSSFGGAVPALALGGTLPSIDQPAPGFTLPSNSGEGIVSLAGYRGKWVVVYFYPADFTPGCTIEARKFQQDLPQYGDRSTAILGISADDVTSHAEFCDAEGLKFPLLADANGLVSKAYGSWIGIRSARHTFIVDPAGVLRATFTGVTPIVHSREVLARLDELQGRDG
ncbi:peroxiredoxin [Myxacorys almedinensis]|uniref:thioredoxin-dependent peroxiredoxin n=1 Tax=Myxacorys almedinensis A TaxID=2690445 RepID=A0A8J7Z679_9CYAN|nr:peroxiredoxin [Myxacorys almedinensis]NDJ18656.1 redoxin domain-containing protein [Myxacorys almedinensis A]